MDVKARTQYDDRLPVASDLDFSNDPGVTKQSDALDCDVNRMFYRYEKGGVLPDLILRDGRYGDFSSVPDFQEACNIVKRAEAQFGALHVKIRNQFDNDPAKFLEFATDPKNIDELENWGLLTPEAVEARKVEREAAAVKDREVAAGVKQAEEDALFARFQARLAK